jgi:hypothetical protein
VVARRNARLSIPDHVTHSRFPSETVILNLDSEQYHGLADVAAEMFEALVRLGRIEPAVLEVSARYDVPLEAVERDMGEFCDALVARGLIVFHDD